MANELGIWLSVSIFLQKSYWHLILREAIHPFLENYILFREVNSLRLEFALEPSENIILSVFIPEEDKHSIAEGLNKSLLLFFEAKKLHPTNNLKMGNAIFMSYPTNSLQYGLYLPPLKYEFEYVQILEDCFSKLMIDAMSDDLIDDESKFTFSLYVLIHFYNLMERDVLVWRNYYQDFSILLLSDFANPNAIEVQYRKMAGSIEEIYVDVKTLKDLPWISKYDCRILEIRNEIKDLKGVILFINHLNFLLFEQLGFSQVYRAMFITFISNLINKRSVNLL